MYLSPMHMIVMDCSIVKQYKLVILLYARLAAAYITYKPPKHPTPEKKSSQSPIYHSIPQK